MTSPSQSVDPNVHTDSILTEIDLELPNQQTAGDSPAVTTDIVQSLTECYNFYDDKAVRDHQDASISVELSAQSNSEQPGLDVDGQTASVKAGDSMIPKVHGVVYVQDQTASCTDTEFQAKSDASVIADGAQKQIPSLDLGISKSNQKRVSFKSQREYLSESNGSIDRDLLSDESATESESDDLVKAQAAPVVILKSLGPSAIQETPKSNGNTDPLLENIQMDAVTPIEKLNQTNSQSLSAIETLNVSESVLDPLLDDSEPINHFIPKKYVKECTDSEFDGELYSEDENNTTPRKKIKSVEPTEEELEIKLIDLEELDFCRFKSQYRLKSAWERIFDKYGHDFEGTSDEIDLNTGEVFNAYIASR